MQALHKCFCDTDSEQPLKKQRVQSPNTTVGALWPVVTTANSIASSSSSVAVASVRFLDHEAEPAVPILPALYTDVIHSILRFVDFNSLLKVTVVNKQWRSAIRSLRPQREILLRFGNQWELDSEARAKWHTSALLTHIFSVEARSHVPYQSLSYNCERLAHFPSLQVIKGLKLKEQPSVDSSTQKLQVIAHFPQTLTTLQVSAIEQSVQLTLNAASELPLLKRFQLALQIKEENMKVVNFRPLLRLTQLQDLTISYDPSLTRYYGHELYHLPWEALIAVVRQMPSLLNDDKGASRKELIALAKQPNQLQQLEWIHTAMGDQRYVEALTQLPGLTAVKIKGFINDASALLRLPRLRSLHLAPIENYADNRMHELVESMTTLINLTALSINSGWIVDDHLSRMLGPLVNLTTLTLECARLRRLTWIRPLATKLTQLKLSYCLQIEVEEHTELFALKQLKYFTSIGSFVDTWTEPIIRKFAPPSENLLILKHFQYQR